jgi:hypothetical protein
MLHRRGKIMLVLCCGLVVGGTLGRYRTLQLADKQSNKPVPVVFHAEEFAQASLPDSAMILARNLAQADAQRCAELANAMLAKRIKVTAPIDPFSTNSRVETYEEMLPSRAWSGLFKRWMKVAPQAAWEFVLAHHSDKLPLREVALFQWALYDPHAAVQAAGSQIDSTEKAEILRACVEKNPALGLDLLRQWGLDSLNDDPDDPFESNSSVPGQLLRKHAETSPAAALEWCQEFAPSELSSVCAGWMKRDEAACLAWLKTQEVEKQKDLLESLLEEEQVSAGSIRQLATLCKPEEIFSSLDDGLCSLANRDASMAQSLIEELLTNPTDRIMARSLIAEQLMKADPRKAMEILLPSLREALPFYAQPTPQFSGFPIDSYQEAGPDYYGVAPVLGSYINLGSAAGVSSQEILQVLQDIHPQYHAWLIGDNWEGLTEALGRPSEWALPFLQDMPREDLKNLLEYFEDPPDAVWRDLKKRPEGTLRDVMSERYLELLIADDAPFDVLMARAKELGGTRLDLSSVYDVWMDKEPAMALQHLITNPDAKAAEWQTVISHGYRKYAAEIQDAVERMPAGELRSKAVQSLAVAALNHDDDIVTSVYWATEISDRLKRTELLRQTWNQWQEDEKRNRDPQILEGVRQNLEHSALDAREKSLWLERLESEGLR